MSDTPRTDAAYSIYDLRKVAQDIERELTEAKELIKRLEIAAWKNYNNSHKAKEDKP